MKIMLIGANGQLGADLKWVLAPERLVPLTHAEIEVTDPASTRQAFERHQPEIVINTAAFHRVDDCEKEAERAFSVNAVAVRDLALACAHFKATLVHFSTDYVFRGDKREPYVEGDLPSPLSVYGASKLAGEYLVAANLRRYFLIRTCGLYGLGGSKAKGGNFVETMLRKAESGDTLRVVDDQVVTPTPTREVARKVAELIRTEYYGLYHATSQGFCTWYQFAAKIFELAGLSPDLRRATSNELRTPARRPSYSVLDNAKLRRLGMDDLKPWEDALLDYLNGRKAAAHTIL